MKRRVTFVGLLLIAGTLAACMTAKQKREEQQELQRSIVQTSDPAAVEGCAFIMNLKSEERGGTPEQQTASLVIPKPDVEWVILQSGGGHQLYLCRRSPRDAARESSSPAPAAATAPPAVAPVAAAPPAAPTAAASVPERATVAAIPAPAPAPAAPTAAPATEASPAIRVTNNPEAVRGCRFLASFTEYQPVSVFREAVARAGGDIAYVVASNKDGNVIGESYRCAAP